MMSVFTEQEQQALIPHLYTLYISTHLVHSEPANVKHDMSKKAKSQTSRLVRTLNALLALLIMLLIITVFVDYESANKSFADLVNSIQQYAFGHTGNQQKKTAGNKKSLNYNKKTVDNHRSNSLRSTDDITKSPSTVSASENTKGLELEPTPPESSPGLKPLVKRFSGWMEFQHKRAGFKIFHKAYAKRQKHACILYLKATNAFLEQSRGKKSQTVEAIWQYWSRHAMADNLVNTPQSTYVIVFDNNLEPLVGSKYKNPEKVWFKN